MPAVYAAFDHSPCIFHRELLENVTNDTLNVHAHLSPFSAPRESYQAPGLAGSVIASASSWPETFARAARPCE